MADQIGNALSGASNLGGQALGGIESGLGSAASGIGNFVGGIPGDISSLLGGGATGSGSPTSPASALNATAAGAGSPAVTSALPAAPSTGISAASVANALPSGGAPDVLSQVLGPSGGIDTSVSTGGGIQLAPGQGTVSPDGVNPTAPAGGAPATNAIGAQIGAITPPQSALSQVLSQYGKYALPAAGIGLGLYQAAQTPPGEKALKQQAAQEQQQARLLEPQIAAEQQGHLPVQAQALIDQQLAKTQAAIRSQYAASGLSGSSAEQQDLQAAATSAQGQAFEIGSQLAQQGISQLTSADSQAGSLLGSIFSSEAAQDQNLAKLLAQLGGLGVAPSTTQSVTTGG